jgi:hypothetical protein
VKTARKGKTLAALERAAMLLAKYIAENDADWPRPFSTYYTIPVKYVTPLVKSAAAHAATKKRKGTK